MEEEKESMVKTRKTRTSRLMYTTTETEYSVPAENQKRPGENSRKGGFAVFEQHTSRVCQTVRN